MPSFLATLLWFWVTLQFLPVHAIRTIEAVGSKFFYSDGSQYFIKGIAYQLTEDDPLVNATQCGLDANLMKELGANTIRVYHVDASADHTDCMQIFADAGIYLFVDLDSFQTYISYDHVPAWTQEKSDSYRAVMDAFARYDNTAGFFVGNENLNGLIDAGTAPFLLAAAVDLKGYRSARGYRKIPIGYSATDTDALPMLQDYFVCRSNETERLEFYSLNSYRWCGDSSYEAAYSALQTAAEGYPVPIWFSEVGCITVPPRTFTDQAAIFKDPMLSTWSGSMVYEWIQEVNKYGLISYGPAQAPDVQIGTEVIQGFTRQGNPTPVLPDFTNLQSQWATLRPTGIASSNYNPSASISSRSCPASTADGWTVDPSAPLPTLGEAYLNTVSPAPSTTSRAVATSGGQAGGNGSPATGSSTSAQAASRTSASPSTSSSPGAASKLQVNPFGFSSLCISWLSAGASVGLVMLATIIVI